MIWTIIWLVVAAVIVAVDQISKVMAVKYLLDGSTVVIPGILNFTYVENDGMALGLLGEHRWVFMTLSTVAIVGLMVYMIGWRPKSQYVCASLSMIIGGGIGNMIDRIFYEGILPGTTGEKVVRDFIDFRGFGRLWPWVFNVADAFVCIGGAMLFLWCIVSIFKEAKEEKRAKAIQLRREAEYTELMENHRTKEAENDETPKE